MRSLPEEYRKLTPLLGSFPLPLLRCSCLCLPKLLSKFGQFLFCFFGPCLCRLVGVTSSSAIEVEAVGGEFWSRDNERLRPQAYRFRKQSARSAYQMHGAEGFLLESFRSIAICLNAGSPTLTTANRSLNQGIKRSRHPSRKRLFLV